MGKWEINGREDCTQLNIWDTVTVIIEEPAEATPAIGTLLQGKVPIGLQSSVSGRGI